MLQFCFCGASKRSKFDTNSQYYPLIKQKLNDNEEVMLELIYADLASRLRENQISLENFLLFFNLNGLWGAKLFNQFDQDGRKLITKEEFFFGLSRTAKAKYEDKIKLMFSFFEKKEGQGIGFKDFTKMLYNYSRDELKQILMQDTYMLSELNPQLNQSISKLSVDSTRYQLTSSRASQNIEVIELDYKEPIKTCSKFDETYNKFSCYRDPGTCVEIRLNNELTYKVNYCNMITLVKEFAKNIYKGYNLDNKTGKLTFAQFSSWIQSHSKLFQSYYTSFHLDLWGYNDNEPNFIEKIEKQFSCKLKIHGEMQSVHAMLINDVLVFAKSSKEKRRPFKTICLEGLDISTVTDTDGMGIEIRHRDEYYEKSTIYFNSVQLLNECYQSLSVYSGPSLHEQYQIHEVIGTGKFSIVYRCTDKHSSRNYALKDISIDKLNPKVLASLNKQSELMRVINHPQIVKYHDSILTKKNIYIIAEYIPGQDLYEFVKKRSFLNEYLAAFIIGQIMTAVTYLHSLEIVHRDLKPENIMVTQTNNGTKGEEDTIENIKIIDFGLSNHLTEIESLPASCGVSGTPNYIAPELIVGEKPTYKIDNFAIGSILYFLLCGKLPFAHKNMEYTLLRTVQGSYDITGERWDEISVEAKDLLSRLLETDPVNRIDLEEALNHDWFSVVIKRKMSNGVVSSL